MIKRIAKKIRQKIAPTEFELALCDWKHKEHLKLRYNYNLNSDSVVFDLGGYHGQYTSDIFAMYTSNVYVFEPVKSLFDGIKKRFEKNPKIRVYHFGLGGTTTKASIGLSADGSSLFNKEKLDQETIQIKKASDFLKENSIKQVDLAKINIEGGEFDLLEHLISSGDIRLFKNVQVQFHNFVPDAQKRMDAIHKDLEKTHKITYQNKFVWENWERK